MNEESCSDKISKLVFNKEEIVIDWFVTIIMRLSHLTYSLLLLLRQKVIQVIVPGVALVLIHLQKLQ